jgi:hypothetical protein
LRSRVGLWVSSAGVALLLASATGCGDDDDDNDSDRENRPEPVAGTFVGKVRDSEAFVAVVAAPPAKGEDRRDVTAFVCDGKELCALFAGSSAGNSYTAESADGDGNTKGRLSGKAATGTVDVPDAEMGRYSASGATATAGLYDLTVSPKGRVTGASAAGVGLTGSVTLPPPGDGRLRLADRSRLRFTVTEAPAADAAGLRAGQMRLIVLPGGEVRGAGRSRGEDGATFFVRSAPKSK